MPPFIALLLKLLPYLPSILRTVEAIHPLPGSGAAKLDMAISLVQTVVPAVVTHLQHETEGGENTNNLKGLIGAVVSGINAAKSWTPPEGQSPFPQ